MKRKTDSSGPGLCSAWGNHRPLLLSGGDWWRRNYIISHSCPRTSKGGTCLISQDSLNSGSWIFCRLALNLTASHDPFSDSRCSFSKPNEGRTCWQKIGHLVLFATEAHFIFLGYNPCFLYKQATHAPEVLSFALGDGCQVNSSRNKFLAVNSRKRAHMICKQAKEEACQSRRWCQPHQMSSRVGLAVCSCSLADKTTSPRNHQCISPRGGFSSDSINAESSQC